MRNILVSMVIFFSLFLAVDPAQALRKDIPTAKPVVYKGVKFVALNTYDSMGYVEARYADTDQPIWAFLVYSVFFKSFSPLSDQELYIKSLDVKDDKLVVIDEKDHKYEVDIPATIRSKFK